jgi:hypothetical protein
MDFPLPFFIFTSMIRAVILVVMVAAGVFQTGLFAQFPDPVSRFRLLEMSEEFARSSGIARQEALEWAKVNNVDQRLEFADGRVIELQYLDFDGVPVFYKTRNAGAALTTRTNTLFKGGKLRLFLSGEGITGGIWDAGRPDPRHPEFSGRTTSKDGGTDNFHATHVAGTMIARGLNVSAKGMAPGAKLVSYDWNADLSEMAAEAAEGLIISNHSYGINLGWSRKDGEWEWNAHADSTRDYRFGFYSSKSRALDEISFNAPEYLIVWAAGNDRNDVGDGSRPPDGPYKSIGPESVAKNVLAVGAVSKIPGGYTGPSDISMSQFSSWGPTNDGRIKPDIVGAGVQLFSTALDESYSTSSGTSMAAPNISGSLMLLQQLYRSRYQADNYLRSATLKGLVIHTAFEAGEKGPDYRYGWGMLNMEKAARMILFKEEPGIEMLEISLADGEEFELDFESEGNGNIVATISWTDPPGRPTAPAMDPPDLMLVNDLDMRIYDETGDEVFYPWRLSPAAPSARATRGDNFRDNVEKITIEDPSPGMYTLKVTHKDSLTGGKQDFSLILQTGDIQSRATLFWIGSSGSWQDGANWSLTSGGEAANMVPGLDDHVVFDEKSFQNEDHAVSMVEFDDNAACFTFNWLTDREVILSPGAGSLNVYSSVIVEEDNKLYADSLTIILAGSLPDSKISINGPGFRESRMEVRGDGTWAVIDSLHVNVISINNGSFIAVDNGIITREFIVRGETAKMVDISNTRIDSLFSFQIMEGDVQLFSHGSELVFSSSDGGDKNGGLYAGNFDLWDVTTTGETLTIEGSNTYNKISVDGYIYLKAGNIMAEMLIYPGSTVLFGEGSQQVISGSFNIFSTEEAFVNLSSDGDANAIIEVLKHTKLCFDYLDISGVTATGQAVLNAGINSIVDDRSEGWLTKLCQDVLFADFDYRYACDNGYTSFTDLSSGNITEWLWEFHINDEVLTSEQKNSHTSFPDTGYYKVSLTVWNDDDIRSHSKNIYVRSNTLNAPEIIVSNDRYTSSALALQYRWFRDRIPIPDENLRSYTNTGEIPGVYQVLIFDATCNIFSEPVIVTSSFSISDDGRGDIKLYPNPAGDYLIVEGSFYGSPEIVIEMFDARGGIVSRERYTGFSDQPKRLDTSFLDSGHYYLRIITPSEIYTGKVIINR